MIRYMNTFSSLICLVLILFYSSCTNECKDIPCLNGGFCDQGICDCPPGYLGQSCEHFNPDQLQLLLDNGHSPFELIEGNIPMEDLIGKIYMNGLIFYLDVENESGLVAALEDYGSDVPWGCHLVEIPGLPFIQSVVSTEIGTRIGDSKPNTDAILAACSDTTSAAYLVRSFGPEWNLPSLNELQLMYLELANTDNVPGNTGIGDPGNIGNFKSEYYWSSTHQSYVNAYGVRMQNGTPVLPPKTNLYNVRAVKSF